MKIAQLFRRPALFFNQRITIMVLGGVRGVAKQWHVTTGFLIFCGALWTGLTVWAGYVAQQHVDYWVTKADDELLRVKLKGILAEMERSRAVLDNALSTDRDLRAYLALRKPKVQKTPEGIGGPTLADLRSLQGMLSAPASELDQAAWHRNIAGLRRESKQRLASFQEISWYLTNRKTVKVATPDSWPVQGRITSPFGYRFSPMGGRRGGEFHPGIDIANRPDTLIRAAGEGTVLYAGWSAGYGEVIVIDHGYGFSTLYGHTSKALVKTGDTVRRGEPIAYLGTTGRSTGSHVHFEIWRWGKPDNPLKYLKRKERSPAHGGR